MAYEKIAGPLGPRRSDYHAALIAATIMNSQRGKRGKRFQIKDFMPDWDDKRGERQSPDQHLAAIKAITRQLSGAVPDNEGGDIDGDPGGSRRPSRRRRR
ncbi:MAG TPA: DUF4035 domain-containing protein [Candidatus Limnocylindrales bacterium]